MENEKWFPRQESVPNSNRAEFKAQEERDLRAKVLALLKTAGLAVALGTLTLASETASAQQSPEGKQSIEHLRKEMNTERYYETLIKGTQEYEPALANLLDGARMREADADQESQGQEKLWYVYLPSRDVILMIQFKDFLNDPNLKAGTSFEDGLKEFDAKLLVALYNAKLIEVHTSKDGKDYIVPTNTTPTDVVH